MQVTPLFAALLGLLYIVLSFSVIRLRLGKQVSLGDGDHGELEKAIRVHGNFSEYVPFALLLMWFQESISLSSSLVFWLGCLLLLARIAHAIGINNPKKYIKLRQFGALGTFLVIIASSLSILWWYIPVSV